MTLNIPKLEIVKLKLMISRIKSKYIMSIGVVLIIFVAQKLNIIHQNINGLLNKLDLLTVSLTELEESKNFVIDVICVTEHNLIELDINLLKIQNYTLASIFSRDTRKGGSCILVRNTYNFNELNLANMSIPNAIECCGVQLLDLNIIIICIYRPPKADKFTLDLFFKILHDILNKYSYDIRKKNNNLR